MGGMEYIQHNWFSLYVRITCRKTWALQIKARDRSVLWSYSYFNKITTSQQDIIRNKKKSIQVIGYQQAKETRKTSPFTSSIAISNGDRWLYILCTRAFAKNNRGSSSIDQTMHTSKTILEWHMQSSNKNNKSTLTSMVWHLRWEWLDSIHAL